MFSLLSDKKNKKLTLNSYYYKIYLELKKALIVLSVYTLTG